MAGVAGGKECGPAAVELDAMADPRASTFEVSASYRDASLVSLVKVGISAPQWNASRQMSQKVPTCPNSLMSAFGMRPLSDQ
jgi:hypothetical protein